MWLIMSCKSHVKKSFRTEIFLLLLWIFSDSLRARLTNDAVGKNNSHIHIINLVYGPAETVTQPRSCVFVGITTSNDDFGFAR